ncbi:MAG: Gfo/Idh/MocA family oxidoreductase [Planctomycetes bacterium]|jgi:predicted dehydrogenase|nr:Gfo/Idh/MocA family oxidoreductase [Planctomycetota bacterium]
MTKKRYVQVGLGGRSRMFTEALTERYPDTCELVALCDVNQGRMDFVNKNLGDKGPLPTYKAQDFDRMIAEQKPQGVIVTTIDRTHCEYICRAMELGCDVISEKPMTVDAESCRKIIKTTNKTGRSLRVTFNYRYSPPRSQVKELIQNGAIGDVLSVDFTWLLDTRHGADYFRRWHRNRANSGSLLVHKSTHHFDLVNWWLADVPEEVFCMGSRKFYTPQQGDARGLKGRGERCLNCPVAKKCNFFLDMAGNENLKATYLDNEKEDGYIRDKCVFGDGIDIWDTEVANVRYKGGALLSYMLHNYSPYEGYRVAFNGTKGRIEHACCEKTYVNGDGTVPGELQEHQTSVTLIPEFSRAQALEVRQGKGGHGGGDPVMLDDIFLVNPPADPLNRRATEKDGAYSILVGIAAYESIDKNMPIRIPDLLGDVAQLLK